MGGEVVIRVVDEGMAGVMVGRSLVGMVGLVVGLAGGTRQPQATFAVVGVYMDDSKANDDNTHIVGTWAMNIELPVNSNSAQVQAAAQAECNRRAGKGLRCAEMGQQNLDVGKRREKPCAAIGLGMYHGMGDDGVRRPYTLWPLKFGFDTADAAKTWARAELRRLPSENNGDPLIREISISTNCVGPSS